MRLRKLTKEESEKLREKPFAIDKHVMVRELQRLGFRKIDEVFMCGEIWQEGKRKFRSVLPIKGGKFLEFKTCGIASGRKFWG